MTDTLPDDIDPIGADPWRLAELVCARFCHDLAGPVGSLAGMVELAREDAGAAEEALSVMQAASAEMGNRLALLRAAWTGDAGAMDVSDIRTLAAGLPNARRLRLDFDAVAPAMLDAGMARMVLNLLLLAAESLPAGGSIGLSGDPGAQLLLRIEGRRAAWPAGFGPMLNDNAAAWAALDGPRNLQAPFTALVASRLGLRLSMLVGVGPGGTPPLLLSAAA